MYFSKEIDIIAPKLVEALADPPSLVRETEGQVGTRKYKYVELDEALKRLRPHFAKFGIGIMQPAEKPEDPEHVKISTVLVHTSGQWVSDFGLELPAPKQDPQGFGSAVTYSRRYGLLAFLGLAQEDDDGHLAVVAQKARKAAPAAPKAAAKVSASVPVDGATGAVVELVEAQGRSGAAALEWIQAVPDQTKALQRTLKDAAQNGVEREKAKEILKSYSLEDLIEVFDAVEVTADAN